MEQMEKYTLQWPSYSDHLREALREMMTSSEFADVTLVTDDKQHIRAHRNILAACSSVLKNILQLDSKIANPVIYLRGIQHSEMESMMEFIYLGEARLKEERITEFLLVSQNLEIKDLSTGIEINNPSPSDETSKEQENDITDNDNVSEHGEIVEHERQTTTDSPSDKEINEYENKVSHEDVGEDTDSVKHAGKQFPLRRHIQSAHEGVKLFACNQCEKQYNEHKKLMNETHSI